MLAAGGKRMAIGSRKLQYRPRELFSRTTHQYRLTGSTVDPTQGISVISRMREGMIYVDGAHFRIPFEYGRELKLISSRQPLKTVF